MSLPEGWKKTRDREGRLRDLKEEMKKSESSAPMTVVLRYERKDEHGITKDEVAVIMELYRGEFDYYWRYDDQSGGELEYEYDVFGDANSSFDKAKSAAMKKVEVVDEKQK
jgi:hypothetical protein